MSIPGKLARTILSNKMTTANAALSLGFGIDSYQTAREEGSGVIGALGAAAFDTCSSYGYRNDPIFSF